MCTYARVNFLTTRTATVASTERLQLHATSPRIDDPSSFTAWNACAAIDIIICISLIECVMS